MSKKVIILPRFVHMDGEGGGDLTSKSGRKTYNSPATWAKGEGGGGPRTRLFSSFKHHAAKSTSVWAWQLGRDTKKKAGEGANAQNVKRRIALFRGAAVRPLTQDF